MMPRQTNNDPKKFAMYYRTNYLPSSASMRNTRTVQRWTNGDLGINLSAQGISAAELPGTDVSHDSCDSQINSKLSNINIDFCVI